VDREDVMRQKHILTALAIFAVTGLVTHSQSLAEAGQGNAIKHLSGLMAKAAYTSNEQQQGQKSEWESLTHKVQADAYSGMSGGVMRSDSMLSKPGSVPGDQSRHTGEYKAGSPGNDGRYGSNSSDNYLKKESSGSSTGPYGGSIYGGGPSTPSADPMIKELSREPSMR
jgi:hypothetical protein